jgi:hypothetical protein
MALDLLPVRTCLFNYLSGSTALAPDILYLNQRRQPGS